MKNDIANMLTVDRCERRGDKIIIVIKAPTKLGTTIYSPHCISKSKIGSLWYNISLREDKDKLGCDISYTQCNRSDHSQLHGMNDNYLNQKDAIRVWYDNPTKFLERYDNIIKKVESTEFLSELIKVKAEIVEHNKMEAKIEAIRMIEDGLAQLRGIQ